MTVEPLIETKNKQGKKYIRFGFANSLEVTNEKY